MKRNRGKQQNGKDQRSLQENQRYQGNISCKDGHNNGQKLDLTEAEDNNSWQEYTEELYKKDLNDPDNHDGVITHLGNITMNKASGGGIPAELFQTLKDDAVKVVHSICQQIWKTAVAKQDCKRSVFIPIPKKGNAKNVQTTAQLHSSHTLAK